MNMREFIFLLSLLLVNASLRAQNSVGLEGGFSYNAYNTNISNRASTVATGGSGFSLDLPFEYEIRPWLYAMTAPGILRKDHAMDRTDSLYGSFEQFDNTYIQLPIGISLVYGTRLKFFFDPGIYLGYWISGRLKG